MATDHAILNACNEGKAPATLRLYGWSRPSITVGYSQDWRLCVDLDRCRKMEVEVVQRPTGGRAMVHQNEISYSVIAPIPHSQFPSNLRGAFQEISSGLIHSLQLMGLEHAQSADGLQELQRTGTRNKSSSFRSPACFASINHFEISVKARKLIGGAQRRFKQAFLQQGSILIDHDALFSNSFFCFSSDEERDVNLKILQDKSITLQEAMDKTMSYEEALPYFIAGFKNKFPGNWEERALTPYEQSLAECRMNEPDWIA